MDVKRKGSVMSKSKTIKRIDELLDEIKRDLLKKNYVTTMIAVDLAKKELVKLAEKKQ